VNPDDIVITGTGAVSAIGETLYETWNSLLNRKSGIQKISSFDASVFPCQIAAEVLNFDANRVGNAYQRKRLDKNSMLALAAVEEAIIQSNILNSSISAERIGVFWASGNGGIRTADSGMIEYTNHPDRKAFSPFFQSNVLIDTAGSRIAQKFYLRGPNITTVSACASGNSALLTAMAYIKAGICDAAIVGGSEAAVSPSVIGGFSSMKALSRNNENPENACRPFADTRDGFVIGEGSAAIVLEKISDTQKRDINPKCMLKAVANANDAGHITNMDEFGQGAARCMRLVLQNANLNADQIDAYSAHGTSTKQGDLSEYRSLQSVFSEHLKYLPIIASKSMTGHLLGASSALEAVLCIEMIHQQILIPNLSANADENMNSPELFMPYASVNSSLKHIMNHASGFGGQHATSIFSKL
jgi:3-oxoacyl-[acyl-carrier-protein] synthase II